MKTLRRFIVGGAALAIALGLLASCSGFVGSSTSSPEAGNVKILIPAYNTKVFSSKALAPSASASKAFLVASYGYIDIFASDHVTYVRSNIYFNTDTLLNGGGDANQAFSGATITLPDGGYYADVRVHNVNNSNPNTPTVTGSQFFSVSGGAATTVIVTCKPYLPPTLGEGVSQQNISLPTAFIFGNGGPPTQLGSETWFEISPTTSATMIVAMDDQASITAPILAIFDANGYFIKASVSFNSAIPTILSFASIPSSTYYLVVGVAAPPGTTVADAAAAVKTFDLSYAAHGSNTYPSQVSAPAPANASYVLSGTDVQLACAQASDADGDPLDYEFHWSQSNSTDGNGILDSGFMDVTKSVEVGSMANARAGNIADGTWYWQVVADDGVGGRTVGPIWSFTMSSNLPPIAVLTVVGGGTQVAYGYSKTFEMSGSYDPDSGDSINGWMWYLDGTPIAVSSSYTYSFTETHTIGLIVYDSHNVGSDMQTVTIYVDSTGGSGSVEVW